jgi:predicted transcriptional regulator
MPASGEPPELPPPPSPYGNERAGPFGPRRSPVDLYAEILEVLRRTGGPARVTRLSYAVGMPVDRTRNALALLVRLGLASKEPRDVAAWRLTRRGYEFLQAYWKMRSFLGPTEGFIE